MFYVRNKNFKSKRVEDEIMIFDAPRNRIITLNSTALKIWSILWKKRTRKEITDALSKKLALDNDTIGKDIDVFLKKAVRMGILELSDQ